MKNTIQFFFSYHNLAFVKNIMRNNCRSGGISCYRLLCKWVFYTILQCLWICCASFFSNLMLSGLNAWAYRAGTGHKVGSCTLWNSSQPPSRENPIKWNVSSSSTSNYLLRHNSELFSYFSKFKSVMLFQNNSFYKSLSFHKSWSVYYHLILAERIYQTKIFPLFFNG